MAQAKEANTPDGDMSTLDALQQLYAVGLLLILYDWPVLHLVQRASRGK